ncbi:SH3 domain-containing protein [Paracoccus hibiscisoli]|uniref:SH3 domain-containing protein n=1 Tax=Paracoccus hibiscisoli TaxID=2023261 RepID=A0A4V5MUV5_9RHOB|nr:SH3 domain-containing protein [Paracoccus hibiscisoli]TJZ81058.1 SH3 domain-containing protein [Paracoccus hibiscisoli]
MIRLGLLMLVTVAGFVLVLTLYGDDDLRAARRPAAPAPSSAAQDAGSPVLTAPAGSLAAQPPVDVVPAASQTPERTQRFPGPALEPSPEYPSGTPDPTAEAAAPLGAEGPVLYVTATRVNMRSGAGTGNPVVTGLDGGTAVEAIGPTGGEWVEVRTPGGQQGFVAGQFLSPDAP